MRVGHGAEPASPGWQRWLPAVGTLRTYHRSWLRKDIIAGIALTALLVPAGMGYAEASGLEPIHGLYATIVPLIVYALAGPSRILVLGPDSALAPLVLAAVLPFAGADPAARASAAAAIAVIAGLLCVGAGLARFGFITDLLSLPVRYGYLNGIALAVIVSQLPKLFGFSANGSDVISGFRNFVDGVVDGKTNMTALALGLGSLILILVLRRVAPRVPAVLVAVVGSIAVVSLFDLADEGIRLVGVLPQGLPSFAVPGVGWSELVDLVGAAVGIAFVSFADTSVLSRSYAAKDGRYVDPNQELVAIGASNLAAGFFQGFAISGSASRTPVAEAAGSKTQVTGVVAAAAITLMLVAVPGLFRNLPIATLAAIVIAAALKLIEIHGVARLWRERRSEFWLSMAAFAGVAVFGVIRGVGLAVALSLLNFVRISWRPYNTELVRVSGLKGYHDADRHPEGVRVPGLLLFRFDAPVFFANAEELRAKVHAAIRTAGRPIRWVVLTAEPITDVDATGASVLATLVDELRAEDITLAFAEMKGVVRDRLARYGLVDRIGPDRFYRTIGQAVKTYVKEEGVDWVDWEDRPDISP